jgi:sulfur-oxidizing protein SoxX
MHTTFKTWLAVFVAVVGGCATGPSTIDGDAAAQQMMKSSFQAKGIATLDWLQQDALQRACSGDTPPSAEEAKKLEAAQLATVQWPTDGRYLGDWKAGEKLAQSGKGRTWKDKPGAANGGSCYNCHQIGKQEVSFGTIGPSLYHYGKVRGVTNPADPASAAVVKYTWGKLWNSKAYAACSNMPRFGHSGTLTQAQIRDLMALLLDPASPVNQ